MSSAVALIAGVARNGVIGADGGIPWRIPSDMAFFRRTTMGKPIIMGRKQYESVGKPLPGRTNILVTRQKGYAAEGVVVVGSLEEALDLGRDVAAQTSAGEVMVIGGGQVYAEAMPRADRLYISHIDLEPEGDIVFPPIDLDQWQIIETVEVPPDARDAAAFRVRVYERR